VQGHTRQKKQNSEILLLGTPLTRCLGCASGPGPTLTRHRAVTTHASLTVTVLQVLARVDACKVVISRIISLPEVEIFFGTLTVTWISSSGPGPT
jgi:hypothetical protein